MKHYYSVITGLTTIILLQLPWAALQAGPLTVPNSFSAGTSAVAAEVNTNFSAVKTAVDDNDSRIAALEAMVATLQGSVATLQSTATALETANATLQSTVTAQAATIARLESEMETLNTSNVMALESYLTVDPDSDPRGPQVRLAGVNLHLVNDMGTVWGHNGLGNLIIGYDDDDTSGIARCSIGYNEFLDTPVIDEGTCTDVGGSWVTTGFKTGSHYLILGPQHNYSGFGGLLAGFRNTSNFNFNSVVGGVGNTASGRYASVSGGSRNTSSGFAASVTGGFYNTARNHYASVSGGRDNLAGGTASHVSGGGNRSPGGGNTAALPYSSILGGTGQTTTVEGETIPAIQ